MLPFHFLASNFLSGKTALIGMCPQVAFCPSHTDRPSPDLPGTQQAFCTVLASLSKNVCVFKVTHPLSYTQNHILWVISQAQNPTTIKPIKQLICLAGECSADTLVWFLIQTVFLLFLFIITFQRSTYHLLDLRTSGTLLTDKASHRCLPFLPVIFYICIADV